MHRPGATDLLNVDLLNKTMTATIRVAGSVFKFQGPDLSAFVKAMPFFKPFFVDDQTGADFYIIEDLGEDEVKSIKEATTAVEPFFDVSFEDITCNFYKLENRIIFYTHEEHSGKELWESWEIGSDTVHTSIVKATATIYRYALWVALNYLLIKENCFAIHTSANVFGDKTLIFLGESGTGKSTHTRLLRERYPESFLLNDDSPFIKVEKDGTVMVYGSPWSGKTPCYKNEHHTLHGIVRLSQAPYNKIKRLSPMESIGALLPSAPPMLNYCEETTDALYTYISDILEKVPVYHLECLPDIAAAELSHDTLLGN